MSMDCVMCFCYWIFFSSRRNTQNKASALHSCVLGHWFPSTRHTGRRPSKWIYLWELCSKLIGSGHVTLLTPHSSTFMTHVFTFLPHSNATARQFSWYFCIAFLSSWMFYTRLSGCLFRLTDACFVWCLTVLMTLTVAQVLLRRTV